MKCPHCNTTIVDAFTEVPFVTYGDVTSRTGEHLANQTTWSAQHQRCPACHKAIIYLSSKEQPRIPGGTGQNPPRGTIQREQFLAHPHGAARPIPTEVPPPYRDDFAEACTVLNDSAKASAALSRRCLQALLRDKVATTSKDLFDQIEEVTNARSLPPYILEGLHAVRQIGNIAAHTTKSKTTGEIVDVEPGEAEWNLDVLESLFDFLFVGPAVAAKRKAALEAKVKDAKKP